MRDFAGTEYEFYSDDEQPVDAVELAENSNPGSSGS
jgi:hypothetical protein